MSKDIDIREYDFDRKQMNMGVVLMDEPNGDALMFFPATKDAANALGVCPGHLRRAILRGVRCHGYYAQWLPLWMRDHDL